MPEPINATLCSYCSSLGIYHGKERNGTSKGEVKYACKDHAKLINVVAELSPSRKKPEQTNQAGLF